MENSRSTGEVVVTGISLQDRAGARSTARLRMAGIQPAAGVHLPRRPGVATSGADRIVSGAPQSAISNVRRGAPGHALVASSW